MAGKNLTVYLTSDVSKFRKGLSRAEQDAKGFGGRMGRVGRKAGLALAGGLAVGAAAAAKFAVEGVQAAVADQSSQAQLALALRNTTKATDEQVAAMEEWIKTHQEATGISDEELRPAMARFLRSTKDVTRAQSLAETAMSISVATGKDYASVASALAKAEDGTTQSLKRLGLTIGPLAQNYAAMIGASRELTKAETIAASVREEYGAKSKEYAKALEKVKKAQDKIANIKGDGGTKWVKELNEQFDGAIAADAKTYAGGVRRVRDAWGELQEAFGTGVLDNLGDGNEKMGDFADTLYDAQPTAASVGEAVGIMATNMASLAEYIGPVVDGLKKIDELSNNFLLSSFPDLVGGTINMGKRAAAQLTGNDLAAYETGYGRTPQSVRPGATGSTSVNLYNPADDLGSVNPNRYARRAQNADARAAARGAASRARP
jgi:putative NIF3 family GTP cyclohydrolase 1 type 2